MINSTAEQLLFIILIIVLPIVLLWAKAKKAKLEEPVMEIGRDKGKLVIGNKDYEV
jgi:hypothetical protein